MPETAIPIVTVRGEARIEVPPDLAGLSVTVHATGSSAEQVRDQLANASGRLREVLTAHEAAIARSSTSGLHVSPVFAKNGAKITGYRGSFSTSVEVHEFDALSDVVFALTPLPNSQVDGPWWSLAATNPAHREARVAAITDARRRAEDYAEAVRRTVGDVVEISDLDGGFGGSPMRMAKGFAMDAESAPSFDFEPAIQTVTGQVTVRYQLR